MRLLRGLLVALLIPALLLGWTGGALATTEGGTPEAEEAAQSTVFVRQDPALGTILTDPAGMTLYLFTKDTVANESVCEGECLANWPAFTAEEPLSLPNGVDGELTLFDRADGTTQVAYNGIPLYYWIKDTAPGDTTGQGVGDVWYVVAPGAEMGVMAPAGTPEASPEPTMDGTVQITLSEFTIEASQTEFKVGETYTFEVTNAGQYAHEFIIEKAGAIHEPLEASGEEAEIEAMEGGATGSLTWTFTEAGNFQFACHLMSHYPMGMAVTIHVTD